jgi:hypothetical protein
MDLWQYRPQRKIPHYSIIEPYEPTFTSDEEDSDNYNNNNEEEEEEEEEDHVPHHHHHHHHHRSFSFSHVDDAGCRPAQPADHGQHCEYGDDTSFNMNMEDVSALNGGASTSSSGSTSPGPPVDPSTHSSSEEQEEDSFSSSSSSSSPPQKKRKANNHKTAKDEKKHQDEKTFDNESLQVERIDNESLQEQNLKRMILKNKGKSWNEGEHQRMLLGMTHIGHTCHLVHQHQHVSIIR